MERGTLDAFLKSYRDRVAKEPTDGASWLILGLFESQRGRDAAAAAAFRQAEGQRTRDPLPCYYLGQALVLVGQPEAAAEAFERAIARKPTRADLLEIYQALGRSYQRTRQNDKALAVWNRLEAQFPNDARVKEQVADALAEESQPAEALVRYEALAKSVKDKYRQVQFQMEAADLKVRLGRTALALEDFERMLGQLNPDSWLYREVRRKIEEVFLRSDDLAGLAAYYERWIKKTPDDVEALARLGKTLANQGRVADARGWFEKAVKLAPSKRELRQALIDQLIQDGKFADAVTQYEAIHKADPKNLDVVREWGRALLRDESKPEPERKAAASAVWLRLTEGAAPDPLVISQVADLFRQADMPEEAIALYKKAIDLAPEATQYREYLGEFLHTLKRSDEAKKVWEEIAEGTRRNAKNLTRLGEVLAGFGYRKEAVDAFAEACRLDDDEFDLRIKCADVLFLLGRFDDMLTQLDAADRLATAPEQGEAVLGRRIKAYQGAHTLLAQAEGLRKELDAGKDATASRWLRLARYLEAEQKLTEASEAVRRAMDLEPKSVPTRTAAARIFEMAGDLGGAADVLRQLTTLDRRGRSEYFANLAKLEARLGRREAALAAGRELLSASPGNPEVSQEYADLCFQLGEVNEGLDVLRRSVRANPADAKVALALAEALARQLRTDEAIELFWRALEKSPELEEKLGTISRLTELYLQQNQFDRLIARLERLQKEPDKQREMALCLAQAHVSSGDLGTARQELERLLATNARDTQLLLQLSTLSESEGDLASAVKFQKQLVEITPTEEASLRLAQLHLRAGENTEAEAIWSRLAAGDKDSARTLQAIDSLLGAGNREAVLALTDRILRRQPDNWDALYREGIALDGLNRTEEATRRFLAILELRGNDDDLGEIAKARLKKQPNRPTGALPSASVAASLRTQMSPLQSRVAAVLQIRLVAGLETRAYYTNQANFVWSPGDFGQVRMMALAWLYRQAEKAKSQDSFLKEHRAARDKALGDPRPTWDWYLLQLVLKDLPQIYEAAKALAHQFPNDPGALWAYLTALQARVGANPGVRVAVSNGAAASDPTPPLSAEELDQVVAAYQGLRRRRPDWGQGTVLNDVLTELKRAKRSDEENRIYREALDSVNDPTSLASMFQAAGNRGDVEALIALSDKSERLLSSRASAATAYLYNAFGKAYSMAQAMAIRAETKGYADIPRLIDHHVLALRKSRQSGQKPRNSARTMLVSSGYYVQIYLPNGQTTNTLINYPTPNTYLDREAIYLLRNAYEIYRNEDLLSDLLAHYRSRSDHAAAAQDRLDSLLVLNALEWWEDDKEGAVEALTKAVELAGGDSELSLALAGLLEQQGEPDEAMAVIDGIEALDNTMVQNRELAALRLAVSTGNVERARLACDRLFGLRLDMPTQTMLAGQMHQLGMHEQAEAVLARARRRAGQQVSVLVTLMAEYQRQDKADLAVQIANQLLRRGAGRRALPPGYYNEEESARDEAIRVLGRSGKLRELIARLEAQAERSPKSVQIQQSLADYYRAANDHEKLRATYERIAKLKPDDARLRFQVASQLAQAGDLASAVEHYSAAVKQDASLLGNNGFQSIMGVFRRARKMEELAKILETTDLRAIGNSLSVGQIVQSLNADPKTKEPARKILTRAWDAFADQRMQLLRYVNRDESWWNQPEAYELSLSAMIPTGAQARQNPWSGWNDILMYDRDGRIVSMLSRLLTMVKQRNKADELAQQVAEVLKQEPAWAGGRALLAVLQAHANQIDEAREGLKNLIDEKNKAIPQQMRWIMAQELEEVPALQDVVTKLYELEVRDAYAMNSQNFGFRYQSPIVRLIAIYRRAGRKDEVRKLLRKLAESKPDYSNYSPQSIPSQKFNDLNELAEQMLQLESTVDAVRLYGEMFAIAATIPYGQNYYPTRELAVDQANQGIERALKEFKPELLGSCLASLLEPKPNTKPGDSRLDLMLTVRPPDIDRAAVFSLADVLIAATSSRSETRAQIQAMLTTLAERSPEDLSVQIGLALTAFASGSAESSDRTTKNLAELVGRTPLETLPEGMRANARQREEAAKQIGLWLVVRACWKVDSVRARGDVFADRAFEAARRQTDSSLALAMLRERGQAALDRGDRAAAEAYWTTMLGLILPKPKPAKSAPKSAKPRGNPPSPARSDSSLKKVSQIASPPPPPVPAGAVAPATTRMASSLSSVTSERFQQATQLARLAVEQGMTGLSLRAVREAIRNGPPVSPTGMETTTRVIRRGALIVAGEGGASPTDPIVENQFTTLVPLWKREGVSSSQIYELLRDAVLPETRPAEVFLYARPLFDPQRVNPGSKPEPRSLGQLLVQMAIDAKRTDDLRRVVEARRGQPLAEPSASVLLALLAIGLEDDGAAGKILDALETRIQRDTLQHTAELVGHAAIPALSRSALSRRAEALLERAVENLGTQAVEEPRMSLLRFLAQHWFAKKELAKARRIMEEAVSARGRSLTGYNVDYELYRSQQLLVDFAAEYSRAGQVDDALELLGRYSDEPPSRYDYVRIQRAFSTSLVRQLSALPVAERYEKLKAWTLPTTARTSVRLLGEFVSQEPPPVAFTTAKLPPFVASDVVSTAGLLLDAAREAGKLEELDGELQQAVDNKKEGAEILWMLTRIARGQAGSISTRLARFASELHAKVPEPGSNSQLISRNDPSRNTVEWPAFLLARACLADLGLAETGERLANDLIAIGAVQYQSRAFVQLLPLDLAASRWLRGGAVGQKLSRDPRLVHWSPGIFNGVRGGWILHEGTLATLGDTGPSLSLAFPLTGSFAFSIDAFLDEKHSFGMSYGGLTVAYKGNAAENLQGARSVVNAANRKSWVRSNAFNRITLLVESDKVRVLLNGHLDQEATRPVSAPPWLFIFGSQRSLLRYREAGGASLDRPRRG